MKLTKKELIQEGMEDSRMITKFPDESERRAALNKAWLEEHPEDKDASLQGERELEITGTIHKTENGEVEVMDGVLHGFNAAFQEELAPFKAEVQKLKTLVYELVDVVAAVADKSVSKETANKFSRNILINPRKLHLKNFINPKAEGET